VRLFLPLLLGVVIAGVVSTGVVLEVASLGGLAALQVLVPAALVSAGIYVLWQDEMQR